MKSLILYGLTALCCGLLGYGLGRPDQNRSTTRAPLPTPQTGSRPLPESAAWMEQLRQVYQAPASRSREAWLKWAFAVPDADLPAAVARLNPQADFPALKILLTRWVRLDPSAAWKVFHEMPLPPYSAFGGKEPWPASTQSVRPTIAAAMLQAWFSQDPAAARGYAKELKKHKFMGSNHPSDPLDWKLEELLRPGPRPDSPEGWIMALEASAATPDPYDTEKVMASWVQEDPDAVCRWMLSKPRAPGFSTIPMFGRSHPALQSELLARYVRGSWVPTEEIPKALQSSRGEYYRELHLGQFSRALAQWAAMDQPAALAWLAAQPDDAIKPFLAGQIAGVVSQLSPQDAFRLVQDLPEQDMPTAIIGLTNGWMKQDVDACMAWVSKIEDPSLRAIGQVNVARHVLTSDPALALRLSARIADEKPRRQIQERIVSQLGGTATAVEKIISGDPETAASLPPVNEAGGYDFGLTEEEYLDF